MTPRRIIGVEKNYDWGDEITIRTSLGLQSTPGTKIAELWCGTHPQGPARLDASNGPLLSDVSGDMNMLVKLLSCDQPLSLQTHPTAEQAREGFAREEALGIPRDAPQRMYRDESDKPEMIVALSPFEALCGFAPVDASTSLLHTIGWTKAAKVLSETSISEYLRWAFEQPTIPSMSNAPDWLHRIALRYPEDKALFIAPLLNHVVLNPGDALSLPAGNLHAYLHGFGLEVMNSSDNVIRAGFTPKHIDVDELLRIVDANPLVDPIARMREDGRFASPSPVFTVADISTANEFNNHHRILLGKFGGNTHYEIVFAASGTTADVSHAHGYVCVQN